MKCSKFDNSGSDIKYYQLDDTREFPGLEVNFLELKSEDEIQKIDK
jgi:hypothetical protein